MDPIGRRSFFGTFIFTFLSLFAAICIFIPVRHAKAAITLVNHGASNDIGSDANGQSSYALPWKPAAGNFLAVAVCSSPGATNIVLSNITDNLGNYFSTSTDIAHFFSEGADCQWGWSTLTNGNSSDTITSTLTGTGSGNLTNLDIFVSEWSGMMSAKLDTQAVATGTANPAATGAMVTTNANDLILGAFSDFFMGVPYSYSPGAGFTTLDEAPQLAQFPSYDEYLIATSTGSYNATATENGTPGGWAAAGIAFEATTTPPSINSFVASSSFILSGGTSTLSWNINNASSVQVISSGYSLSTSTLVGSTTVNPTSTLLYTLIAANPIGTSTATTSISIDAPPSTPTSVVATATGTSTIALSWATSTDSGGSGLAGYAILRCGGVCTPTSSIATSSVPNFSDSGLAPAATYTYAIEAYDTLGLFSPTSTSVSAAPETTSSNIYIAQSAVGVHDGADCNDAYAISFFNTTSNWAASTTPGKIGPGATVHLCGIFTAPAGTSGFLTFQGGGASGNPVTLLFESGAVVQAPYWGANGAITASNANYITVNFGTNGVVESTANGSAFSNQQANYLAVFSSVNNLLVECASASSPCLLGPNYVDVGPIAIASISGNGSQATITCATSCQFANGSQIAIDGTSDSSFNTSTILTVANATGTTMTVSSTVVGSSTGGYLYDESFGAQNSGLLSVGDGQNITIQNLHAQWAHWCLDYNYHGGYTDSNVIIQNNTIRDCDHGVIVGAGNSNATLSNVSVANNDVSDGYLWDDSPLVNDNHHDGFHTWGQPGSSLTGLMVYGNYFHGNWGAGFNSFIFLEDNGSTPYIFDNVINDQGSLAHAGCGYICMANGTDTAMFVANNTIIGTGLGVNFDGNSQTGGAVYNNVFENESTAVAVQGGATMNTSDYNDFYNVNSGNGWNLNTLPNWQALGYDTHSTVGNPTLDASYIPQSGSAVIGIAKNLTSQNIIALDSDKAGVSRPATAAWDVGAYQYVPPAPSISSFSSSPTSITQGSSATLSWNVSNASSVSISGNNLNLTTSTLAGSYSITPNTTGNLTYALEASNANGSTTATTSIIVNAPSSGGGGGGGGSISVGGGGGYYFPPTTPSSTPSSTASSSSLGNGAFLLSLPASSSLSCTASSTSTPCLEALLSSLETELCSLIPLASAKGISFPAPSFCTSSSSSSSPQGFTKNLFMGMHDPQVKSLQEYLNSHGFIVNSTPGYAGSQGYETKYFGMMTKAALMRFQASHGLPATGYFGPITRGWIARNPY